MSEALRFLRADLGGNYALQLDEIEKQLHESQVKCEAALAACAQKDEALHFAWRDILEWLNLATNHRKSLGPDADHAPYCATRSAIKVSEGVQKTIALALSSSCGTGYVPVSELDQTIRLLKSIEAVETFEEFGGNRENMIRKIINTVKQERLR